MTPLEKGSGEPHTLPTHGWNLLAEEVSFPVAVLDQKALHNNAQWMQQFCDDAQVKLAPHGKTTMAPELFKTQLEHGCWGLSLATVPQVVNAYRHGIKRVILANQLLGAFHFKQMAALLLDPEFEFYCFVDSVENVDALGRYFSQHSVRVNILIELGVEGGRCGWRDTKNLARLTDAIAQHPSLSLCGLSFYEGVIHGESAESAVIDFVENSVSAFESLKQKGCFSDEEPIITGAGSAWYDVVASVLAKRSQTLNFTPVLRPGCYLIHDTGIYQDAQQTVMERSRLACDIEGDLASSLSVWAYVHSVPEPGLAIVGLGKRDAAFDAGLPMPQQHFRPGRKEPTASPSHWQTVKMMDQHCMLNIGLDDDVKPGDLIRFSTSHPCLTFDKWRRIGIVDDHYTITQQIETFF